MIKRRLFFQMVLLVFSSMLCRGAEERGLAYPDPDQFTPAQAARMHTVATGALAPVYAPLARQIREDFQLADQEGIGIDIGGGTGGLTLALAEYTVLHWVNADINPFSFPYCFEAVRERHLEGRISTIFADVHALPFQDNYASCIVSRGSFWAWEDWPKAFSEIYRVLKPGACAYIGRGFARGFAPDAARAVRGGQKTGRGGPPKYDPEATAERLRACLTGLEIPDFSIELPTPEGVQDLTYGVWVTIRKPKAQP